MSSRSTVQPTPPSAATTRLPFAGRAADLAAGLAGAVGAGVGIATAELLAGLVPGAPSLIIAIGNLLIDLQPPGAKDVVVDLFGTNDKLAVNLLIAVAAVSIAGVLGVVGRRSRVRAVGGFVSAGVIGVFAALRDPLVSPVLAVVVPVVAVLASLVALGSMLDRVAPPSVELASGAAVAKTSGTARSARVTRSLVWLFGWSAARSANQVQDGAPSSMDWDRRNFLKVSGALAAGSVAIGVAGRWLLENRSATPSVSTGPESLPPVADVPVLPPGSSLDVSGITPLVMPNDEFYRIDTALFVPRVDVQTWQLKVHGMVDHEVVLNYADLRSMSAFEQYVTIACVSNKVGDDLVGNAKWTGVHLRDVLSKAGVRAGATQIVGRSVDGFTVGFPTEWAMDPARDPMIALGMNDELLPIEHGFPARLIIPGLYGYVSATKWLAEIELTTLEAFDAYWVRLGWAKEAPILTQSRIDVPRNGAQVPAGKVTVAGVAWAPDRGVTKVELKIDDGPWQAATLSTPISKATWVQWKYNWTAAAGSHRIEVRATDGTGVVQTDQVTPPAPDGARGHHHVQVQVG